MYPRIALFAALASVSSLALAQSEDLPMDDYGDAEQEIVVTGQKPRGSVIGDIPAENVLDSRDIRATGATSISELLDAVAPQTGSARGRDSGPPVLLLNGKRISSFREMRDLPPEAIERMEILPEEVALKYGYSADQRVVNIVLRQRFNSTSLEARGKIATDGGYQQGQTEATRLLITNGQRTSLNLKLSGNTPLYESERDIALQYIPSLPDAVDPRPYRTLTGSSQDIRLSGTANRQILGDVSATLNGELQRTTSQSRFGVPTATLDDDGTEILRAFPNDPLTRNSVTEAGRLAFALNGRIGKWNWSSTGNLERSRSLTETDRGVDVSGFQARLDAGDPMADPLGDIDPLVSLGRNRVLSNRLSLGTDLTANGPLLSLPAGTVNTTLKVAASSTDLDSRGNRDGDDSRSKLGRDIVEASASIDVPITKRASAIGRLTANANAGVQHLSDFGTLTSLGAGLNWSPAPKLNFIASWTREEGAPSLQQLGDPLIETENVQVFDFATNQNVLVTTVIGGNPALKADTRNVFKIGGNWQVSDKPELRLRAEYVRQTIDDLQAGFPVVSPALEAAFPYRFTRDADGNLTRIDLRAVNFDRSRRDQVRIGFDFSKELKSKPPSEKAIAALREQFRARAAREGAAPPEGASQSPPAPDAAPPPPGGGGPGGGRGFGRFAGGNGGRLTFSLTDTVTLVDEVTIRPGLPKLDYLDGEANGGQGGRPRHEVEAQAGYFNNGFGARLSANWRSGTTATGATGDLNFSPYATFDLRLFANLGQRIDLIAKHPWLRGTSVRFEVTNIFNSRPEVRDSVGDTPLAYQPDLIEPIGRTVGITIRKLFIPRRFFTQNRGRQPGN